MITSFQAGYPGFDLTNGNANKYLYNKKELQGGLALYDYDVSSYDPVVGRWTSVDPLAELGRR